MQKFSEKTKYFISCQVALSKLFGCEVEMNVNIKVDYKLQEGKNDAAFFTAMFPLTTAIKKKVMLT